MYSQNRKGLLKDDDWEGLRESVFEGASHPGMRAWWKSNSFRFNPDFRQFVEEELRKRAARQADAPDRSQAAEE